MGVVEIQGITRETGEGDGECFTGPGAMLCSRENPKATKPTKTMSAAASDSSRNIERRRAGERRPAVAAITVTWRGGGGRRAAVEGGGPRRTGRCGVRS